MTIRSFIKVVALFSVVAVFSTACTRSNGTCSPDDGVILQILGSGGPIADDGRASSGYLVWVDGESRVLIDAGGGILCTKTCGPGGVPIEPTEVADAVGVLVAGRADLGSAHADGERFTSEADVGPGVAGRRAAVRLVAGRV